MGSGALLLLLLLQVAQLQSSLQKCSCGLKNATLTLIENQLQLVEEEITTTGLTNISRCFGGCEEALVCRPTLTSLQTVTVPVPWKSAWSKEASTMSVTLAVEEHKSCRCVDPNSINVTLNVDVRLRRQLEAAEDEKLSRELRSVAPTISNAIITTTAGVRKGEVTNREIGPDGVKPTEHEIVYYKTCLACREQQDLCRVNGQIYDSDVCHCVYPASRTFLNSFYTLGVVMLTVMVCCFLVFGVQKGDENVLNSSRRSSQCSQCSCGHQRSQDFDSSTRRSTTCSSRRCSSAVNQHHHHVSRQSSRRYSSRGGENREDLENGRPLNISTNPEGNGAPQATVAIASTNSNGNPDTIIVKAETTNTSS